MKGFYSIKMKLLFDGTVYQRGTKYHGGGEYSNSVFRELLKHLDSCTIEVFFDPNYGRSNPFFSLCKEAGIRLHAVNDPVRLRRLILSGGFTRVYSALPLEDYYRGLKLPQSVSVVFTVHGLRQLERLNENMPPAGRMDPVGKWLDRLAWIGKCRKEYREAYSHYQWQLGGIGNGSVITVSNHSKYSLMSYYPELKEKDIRVFYSPPKIAPEQGAVTADILKKYGVSDKRFGLLISADREEKNAVRGMIAYDRVFSTGGARIPADYKVIVLGVDQKNKYRKYVKNTKRFVLEKYVSAEELEAMYRHAQLFLYPTLNEGFGYPPLEAMKYGTLCACSAVTSVPELCGNAVLYFNPMCVEEMANRILQSFDQEIVKEKTAEMSKRYPEIEARQLRDLQGIAEYLTTEAV